MSKVTKEILIVESEAVIYAQYKHREEELMVMFNRGAIYDRAGALIASTAQEGLVRPIKPKS